MTAPERKPCPACRTEMVRPEHLMCRPCWASVPRDMKAAVIYWWTRWRKDGDARARPKFAAAASAAIARARVDAKPVQLALLPNEAGRVASRHRDDS